MKSHYFDQQEADKDDFQLEMCKPMGYVPRGRLLGGTVVMDETNRGVSACAGCACDRDKCGGRPRAD